MGTGKLTLKQQAYDRIFDDVLEEQFPMDEFLTEKQLTERYAMSKAPVREALIELCKEGILRSIPRLGYQIVPVTEKDVSDATELRLLLELGAFDKTARHFNETMLLKVSRLNQEWWQDAISGNMSIQTRWKHNSLFHTTLCSFGGNSLAVQVVEKMIKLEWRAYSYMLSAPEKQDQFFALSSTKYHVEMEKALARGDMAEARELLRTDITVLKEQLFH